MNGSPPVAESTSPAAAIFDFSSVAPLLEADPVVQGVMIVLAFASIGCWAIIFDKVLRLVRLRREVVRFETAIRTGAAPAAMVGADVCTAILDSGRSAAGQEIDGESFGDTRERCERSMRAALAAEVRGTEPGLSFLATVGSTAPFVGLFGTVWGIMNSFSSIARSSDTSLAVVAPGIAEALLATALGLVAAIPAVVAYNRLTTSLGHVTQRLTAAIAEASTLLLRHAPPRHVVQPRAAE